MKQHSRAAGSAAKREHWQEQIQQWKNSGLSQAEFCRRNGLKPHQWWYWKKRLAHLTTPPVKFVRLDEAPTQVYLALGSTNMRKSIKGLSILVEDELDMNPFSGSLIVSCNLRRNMTKVLYWDRNGFCIWIKRLEKHSFQWPGS